MKNSNRQQLILEYYPLVRQIALRVIKRLPSHIELDDLIHIGTLGLIEAIDKYNPLKTPSFNAYARMRIQGSIYDAMRQHDWVPRSVRDRAKLLKNAEEDLKRTLKRQPDAQEIASHLNVSLERYQQMQKRSNIRSVISMEDGAEENQRLGDLIQGKTDDPLEIALGSEQKAFLSDLIKTLPLREQQIITLYYFKDHTFKEIAKTLGLTESRISQLHSDLKDHLRLKIKEEL